VLPNALGPTDAVVASGELTALDISDSPEIATALSDAGITHVVESPDDPEDNQTLFDTTTSGSAQIIEVVDSSSGDAVLEHVVVLGSDAITRLGLRPLAPGDHYVVFGLGNNSEVVGEVMVSAPVHSRQEEGAVVDRYARFMPVFRVEGTSVSLVTVVTLEDQDGVATVTGVSDYLRTFYDNRTLSD